MVLTHLNPSIFTKKEKHYVVYSGRLPNFQVIRDCIDLLNSKASAKAKYSIMQDYFIMQQSLVTANVCYDAVVH